MAGQYIAAFEGNGAIVPYENFEAGWGRGNQESIAAFSDDDLVAATFNGSAATVEDFTWGWKSPVQDGTIPVVSDAAFTLQDFFRNKARGGGFILAGKPGGNILEVSRYNWIAPSADAVAAGDLYFFMQPKYQLLSDGDGATKQFGFTLLGLPAHEGTLKISAVINGVEMFIYDDGAGALTGDALDPTGVNTVDYLMGVINIKFATAPDAEQPIEARHEAGGLAGETSAGITKLQRPPFNHVAITEFSPSLLVAATFDGGATTEENFEDGWSTNENSKDSFDAADLDPALYDSLVEDVEDFENYWRANETAATHIPPPTVAGVAATVAAATFDGAAHDYEDFEGTWPTIAQI